MRAASNDAKRGERVFAVHNLRHAYHGQDVLRIESWQAGQGAHWLLLGPSGSGKTTLLHILAAILKPTAGSVTVAGQDLGALPQAALDRFRGRHVGIVLQRLHLVAVTGWIWVPAELWLIALALGVGIVAALLPAWRAYRTDIARTLARG